ncbi:Hypothetical predicted protein [Pelobates cultripes]|uniref:Uncharacterized protein n=1 Tax=Pelobates cultripes TaxID=61616 RepID=A0AAD1SR03_PELCU|nr:Hypothetical predicted protein [Pelobates cultripes]
MAQKSHALSPNTTLTFPTIVLCVLRVKCCFFGKRISCLSFGKRAEQKRLVPPTKN